MTLRDFRFAFVTTVALAACGGGTSSNGSNGGSATGATGAMGAMGATGGDETAGYGGSNPSAGATSVAGLGGSAGGGVATAGTSSSGARAGTNGAGGSANVAGTGGTEMAGAGTGGTAGTSTSSDAGQGGEATLGTPVEESIAVLPAARQEHGVVAAHGEVFVLGGYAPDITASVLAYDPAAGSWHSVADFPSPFNHPAAGVVGDKIYVAGFYAGTSLTGPATGQTYVYDPVADSWQKKSDLPDGTARAGGCVAVVGTKLYVFGGGNSGEATALASVYDTASDTWEALPPLPQTREHCGAFESGGKLYIASGRTHTITEFRPPTLEYDPDLRTYTEKTPIPTPRGGAASAVLDGRLFLFGGEGADNTQGVFPNIDAYDAATDTWEAFPPLIVPRHGFGGATLGDRIYLPGGAIRQGGAASDLGSVFYFK